MMGMMAALSAAQGLSAFGSAYAQAQAARAQGDYQKSQAEANMRLAEMASDDAIRRGDKDAERLKKQGKKIAGSQRVALAAQGIEIDKGSAAQAQEDTSAAILEDVITIKNNAWREAWGYKLQAVNYEGQGNMAQLAARNESRNTLLAGGMRALQGGGEGAYYYSKMDKA